MPKTVAKVTTAPPPTGGWNARDEFQQMDPRDALVLDNLIPDVRNCHIRGGTSVFATCGGPVETVAEYTTVGGTQKLLAAALVGSVGKIFDASTGTPVELATGLTNARFQTELFSTTGGNFLALVNGIDGYRTYDGATVTNQTAAVTGTSGAVDTFAWVCSHMSRLWFGAEGSTDVWYLDTQAITGAATKLPLGPLLRSGGSIIAMGSWTRDGGSGLDDYAVFVSNRGELLLYRGTDPASATTWQFVGRFKIADPVGKRCIVKAGADLAILTTQGIVPLSAVLDVNESGQAAVAFTDKIIDAFKTAYDIGGSAHGWSVVEFPRQNLFIVNVPYEERGLTYQFVLNAKKGAWCRFTDISAIHWSRFGSRLVFGAADGKIYEYDPSIYTDNGAPITATYIASSQSIGSPMNKRYTMARPRFKAPEGYIPHVTLRLDYDDTPVATESITATDEGFPWDTTKWDTAGWGTPVVSSALWQSVGGIASTASLAFSVSAQVRIEYEGCDLLYEPGGLL